MIFLTFKAKFFSQKPRLEEEEKDMICVKCNCEMAVNKNGVRVRWEGNYIRHGDRYKCPRCGVEIVRFSASTKSYHDDSEIGPFLEVRL